MAILVPMRAGSDTVAANISIKGIVLWHFLYAADDAELAKSGTSAEISVFTLGEPDKLNRDVNSWHIVLMNPTAAAVDFETSITWTQAGAVIATWPEDGPQSGNLKAGENAVFDDSAFLAIIPATTMAAVERARGGPRVAQPARRRSRKRGGR